MTAFCGAEILSNIGHSIREIIFHGPSLCYFGWRTTRRCVSNNSSVPSGVLFAVTSKYWHCIEHKTDFISVWSIEKRNIWHDAAAWLCGGDWLKVVSILSWSLKLNPWSIKRRHFESFSQFGKQCWRLFHFIRPPIATLLCWQRNILRPYSL